MLRAGSGLSLLVDPAAAGREAAAAAVARCGADAFDVLVFASHHHAARLAEVVAGVRAAATSARVVACTGYGALTEAHEVEEAAAVAVLAIAGSALALAPLVVPAGAEAGQALGERLAAELGARTPAALVLLPGADAGWPEEILAGLPAGLAVYGAGLSGPWEPPVVGVDEALAPGGTLALALRGAVGIDAGHSFSLRPAGPAHRVTAARGDRILALDGRPARDVLVADVGEPAPDALFLGVAGEAGVGTIDVADDALLAPGRAREGAEVRFYVRDSAGARADLDGLLARLQAQTAARPPVFGLYFNCAARGRDLHGAEDVDVALIRSRFPGLPLAGLFGSFELAPVDGVARLHAYTGVLVLVGPA